MGSMQPIVGFLHSGGIVTPSETSYDKSVHLKREDIDVANWSSYYSFQNRSIQKRNKHLGWTHNNLFQVEGISWHISHVVFFSSDIMMVAHQGSVHSECKESTNRGWSGLVRIFGTQFQNWNCHDCGKKWLIGKKIKAFGRWESSAYLVYVRLSRKELS